MTNIFSWMVLQGININNSIKQCIIRKVFCFLFIFPFLDPEFFHPLHPSLNLQFELINVQYVILLSPQKRAKKCRHHIHVSVSIHPPPLMIFIRYSICSCCHCCCLGLGWLVVVAPDTINIIIIPYRFSFTDLDCQRKCKLYTSMVETCSQAVAPPPWMLLYRVLSCLLFIYGT